jgi:ParB-like chromosome segregation protein Spo0J
MAEETNKSRKPLIQGDDPAAPDKLAAATEADKSANIFGVNSIRAATNGAAAESRHNTGHKIEMIAVDRAKPRKANARAHSPKQIRQIAESIQAFGFNNPILLDEKGEILAGHGRLEAAKLLDLKEVPTLRISHLSAAEKRAYLLADNRTAELAEWDLDLLATELGDLLDLDFAVELTGFDLDEIQEILDIPDEDAPEKAGVEGHGAEDEIVEPVSRVPVSRAGDEWLLGEHRLVCAHVGEPGVYTSVDYAIRSWQTFAGRPAKLAGADKTFAQIEQERKTAHSQSASKKREAA